MQHIVNRPGSRCNPPLQFPAHIFITELTQRAGRLSFVPGHFRCHPVELYLSQRRFNIFKRLLACKRHQGLAPQCVCLSCKGDRIAWTSAGKEI